MRFVYNEKKTAQAAAHLLMRSGGRMPYIKLIKLLYLADRQSLQETGYPITGDRLVSMDHGPVLSKVLDFITWGSAGRESMWAKLISPPQGYDISLLSDSPDSDELAEYEVDVLNQVFEQFGKLEKWELVRFTHELPEYVDTHGTSVEIDPVIILREAGFGDKDIQEVAAEVEAIRSFKSMYSPPG